MVRGAVARKSIANISYIRGRAGQETGNLRTTLRFTPSDGSPCLKAGEITMKVKETTCTVGFDTFLPVGKGVLEFKFTGILNDKMAGFYRSACPRRSSARKHICTYA